VEDRGGEGAQILDQDRVAARVQLGTSVIADEAGGRAGRHPGVAGLVAVVDDADAVCVLRRCVSRSSACHRGVGNGIVARWPPFTGSSSRAPLRRPSDAGEPDRSARVRTAFRPCFHTRTRATVGIGRSGHTWLQAKRSPPSSAAPATTPLPISLTSRSTGPSASAIRALPLVGPGVRSATVGFEVSTEAYGQFMGRFSVPLAEAFIRFVGIEEGQTALDVGCGAGALTVSLVEYLGVANVAALDPSSAFVSSLRKAHPDWTVRQGSAESMPFPDEQFDRTLAQLVVHFMTDPVEGLREMARVTRPGGVVAASVWDHAGDAGPLAAFWRTARDLDPAVRDESGLPGVAQGHLESLFEEAGMPDPRSTVLRVAVHCQTFDDWWTPFTLGVGPAGEYVASLAVENRERLRLHCLATMPTAPFTVNARAWTVCFTKEPSASLS
jgi:SAM-dependent methyltransferase